MSLSYERAQPSLRDKRPHTITLQGPPVARLKDASAGDDGPNTAKTQSSAGETGTTFLASTVTGTTTTTSTGSLGSLLLRRGFSPAQAATTAETVQTMSDARNSESRRTSMGPSMSVARSEPPGVTQHPLLLSDVAVPPSASFYDPDSWTNEFKRLRASAVKSKDLIALSHKEGAEIVTKSAVRAACCVRVLPSLETVKAALRRPADERRRQRYEMWESVSAAGGDAFSQRRGSAAVSSSGASRCRSLVTKSAQRGTGGASEPTRLYMPPPSIWAIAGVNDSEINVYEAFSGRPLMRVRDPKANVPATSLLHAPFRGFMNRHLKVLPIEEPADLLRLKSSQLIETDWVWVGFTDGSIRLFPANPSRIRDTDRAEQFSKGELADLVFELPKYHSASIVSIVRSPCHRDDEGTDLSTINRLSTAVQYMTAAGASNSDQSREHLSLMCTASADSSIVVWDVRKIYQTLEAMRIAKKEDLAAGSHAGGVEASKLPNSGRASTSARASVARSTATHRAKPGAGSAYASEVISIEGLSGGGEKISFTVRSSCTMVKVRPLMRLKGGYASFKTLQWVSTLVTTDGYVRPRRTVEMTRDGEEPDAPKTIKDRRPQQLLTRFERREEHRQALCLSESDMREVEDELLQLMPPLSVEPPQAVRVNLLIAGDNLGTVHVWNLDEELSRKNNDPYNDRANSESSRRASRARSPLTGRGPLSESPVRSLAGKSRQASPSVSVSAYESTAGSTVHGHHGHDLVSKASSTVSGAKKKRTMTGTTKTARPTLSATTPSRRAKSLGSTAVPVASFTSPSATATRTPARKGVDGAAASSVVGSTATKRVRPSGESAVSRHSVSQSRAGGRANSTSPARCSTSLRVRPSVDPHHDADEDANASLSRLQLLALQRGDNTTPLRELNRTMEVPDRMPSPDRCKSPESGSRRQGRRSVSSTMPGRLTTRKSASRAVRESEERAVNSGRLSSIRVSPSRPSAYVDTSALEEETKTKTSPRRRRKSPSQTTARASPTRSTVSGARDSLSPQHALNEYLTRTSHCRIEFTGGVAINGMAVDAPPVLRTTLRRVPHPQEKAVSLLEEPTAEEREQRVLENTFDTLTEDKALFFVFQQLQLYIAVEGAVLNLRCVPSWLRADADGRTLFASRGDEGMRVVERQQLQQEMSVDGSIQLAPSFSIQLRKLMLEAHSQPISALFLDHGREHLWVARNDGIMSLFATRTKKMVTRVPHPCADAALGAPNQKDWRAKQREILRELGGGGPLRLEQHRECRHFDAAAFFASMVPFGRRTQVSMVLTNDVLQVNGGAVTHQLLRQASFDPSLRRTEGRAGVVYEAAAGVPREPREIDHTLRPSAIAGGVSEFAASRPYKPQLTQVPYSLSSLLRVASGYLQETNNISSTAASGFATTASQSFEAAKIDGCSDLVPHARRREQHLGLLMSQLQWCHGNADGVRRSQKAFYESECGSVGDNVLYVMRELGAYTTLSLLHRCYDAWLDYTKHFPRQHVMRKQGLARLTRSAGAATAMARSIDIARTGTAFRRWYMWRDAQRARRDSAGIARVLLPRFNEQRWKAARHTAAILENLVQTQQRSLCFTTWQAWVESGGALTYQRSVADTQVRPSGRSALDSAAAAPSGDTTPTEISGHATPRPGSGSVLLPPPPMPATVQDAAATALEPQASDNKDTAVPSESPRATSPLVRTFTRRYRASSIPTPHAIRKDLFDDAESESSKDSSDSDDAENGEKTGRRLFDAVRTPQIASKEGDLKFVKEFLSILKLLYLTRPAIMRFRESRNFTDSVLDESWLSIVESAEGGADTDDDTGRRLGVFCFGLLPLLQGLLSTADDVLPNLNDHSVAEEVVSMLNGIQLCMDYVTANADEALYDELQRQAAEAVARQDSADASPEARAKAARRQRKITKKVSSLYYSAPDKLYLRVLAIYAEKALKDHDSFQAMKEVAAEKENLEAFILFVEDDRFDPRRRTSVSLH